MREASKTRLVRSPDFSKKYLSGRVLDIGAAGDLVCAWAESFDLDNGGCQCHRQYFEPETFDSVHRQSLSRAHAEPGKRSSWLVSILSPAGF